VSATSVREVVVPAHRGSALSLLPPHDRPREKLKAKGVESLTDRELLAVLLGSGTRKFDVLNVAERILKELDGSRKKWRIADLQKIEGVGGAKAMKILAAMEFARRRIRPEGFKISFPADVVPLIRHYADRKQEHLICVTLNGANEIIASRVVTVGLADKTQVHPREVFADALTDRATAVIIAHNHPGADLTPTHDDIESTKHLKTAGETLGIKLLDHIIFNVDGYYSFVEKEILQGE